MKDRLRRDTVFICLAGETWMWVREGSRALTDWMTSNIAGLMVCFFGTMKQHRQNLLIS